MPIIDQIGLFIAGVVAFAALFTALGVIFKGFKGFWKFLVKFVKTVDVIAVIPGRLDKIDATSARKEERLDVIEQTLEAHILQAAEAAKDYQERVLPLFEELVSDMRETRRVAEETHHEVRNNGGSSLKDSAHRIESALGLAHPRRTPGNDERDTSPEGTSAS